MNHTQRAIEMAVDNGYLLIGDKPIYDESIGHWYVSDGNGGNFIASLNDILNTPLFWQFIGKALGWGKMCCFSCGRESTHTKKFKETDSGFPWDVCVCGEHGRGYKPSYTHWWHKFIDTLASGQTPDDFFATILPADK